MRPKRAANDRRSGLSLLEMMVATAIMATLMASVVVVMRSGYAVWNAQEADIDVLENGYGVLRHFVQQMRQADSVTAISAAERHDGRLVVPDGDRRDANLEPQRRTVRGVFQQRHQQPAAGKEHQLADVHRLRGRRRDARRPSSTTSKS